MDSVKRYDLVTEPGSLESIMEPADDGEYILHSDYAALQKSLANEKAERDVLEAMCNARFDHIAVLQQQLDTANARIAAGLALADRWNVLTIGNRGAAYDSPNTRRAFTYADQPGNINASKLGRACDAASNMSAGDSIDRGLCLLKALQSEGFGAFQIAALAAPQVEMVGELPEFLAANEAAYGYRPDVYAGVLTNGRDADRYMGWQLAQAALNARAGGDGWLPIESAPKDGSEFLAVRSNGSGYEVARWSEAEELFFDTSSQFIVPEWLSHWQPLPTPPAALASQAVGVGDGN